MMEKMNNKAEVTYFSKTEVGYFSEEVQAACELLGVEYKILLGEEAKNLYRAVEQKYFVTERSDLRWTKREIKVPHEAYYDEKAWKTIYQITNTSSIYIMFDYERDPSIVFIKDGSKISDVLGECFVFVYYITDTELSYLLFRDFHDVFYRLGEKAIQTKIIGEEDTAELIELENN
jgi:hypothetical protein